MLRKIIALVPAQKRGTASISVPTTFSVKIMTFFFQRDEVPPDIWNAYQDIVRLRNAHHPLVEALANAKPGQETADVLERIKGTMTDFETWLDNNIYDVSSYNHVNDIGEDGNPWHVLYIEIYSRYCKMALDVFSMSDTVSATDFDAFCDVCLLLPFEDYKRNAVFGLHQLKKLPAYPSWTRMNRLTQRLVTKGDLPHGFEGSYVDAVCKFVQSEVSADKGVASLFAYDVDQPDALGKPTKSASYAMSLDGLFEWSRGMVFGSQITDFGPGISLRRFEAQLVLQRLGVSWTKIEGLTPEQDAKYQRYVREEMNKKGLTEASGFFTPSPVMSASELKTIMITAMDRALGGNLKSIDSTWGDRLNVTQFANGFSRFQALLRQMSGFCPKEALGLFALCLEQKMPDDWTEHDGTLIGKLETIVKQSLAVALRVEAIQAAELGGGEKEREMDTLIESLLSVVLDSGQPLILSVGTPKHPDVPHHTFYVVLQTVDETPQLVIVNGGIGVARFHKPLDMALGEAPYFEYRVFNKHPEASPAAFRAYLKQYIRHALTLVHTSCETEDAFYTALGQVYNMNKSGQLLPEFNDTNSGKASPPVQLAKSPFDFPVQTHESCTVHNLRHAAKIVCSGFAVSADGSEAQSEGEGTEAVELSFGYEQVRYAHILGRVIYGLAEMGRQLGIQPHDFSTAPKSVVNVRNPLFSYGKDAIDAPYLVDVKAALDAKDSKVAVLDTVLDLDAEKVAYKKFIDELRAVLMAATVSGKIAVMISVKLHGEILQFGIYTGGEGDRWYLLAMNIEPLPQPQPPVLADIPEHAQASGQAQTPAQPQAQTQNQAQHSPAPANGQTQVAAQGAQSQGNQLGGGQAEGDDSGQLEHPWRIFSRRSYPNEVVTYQFTKASFVKALMHLKERAQQTKDSGEPFIMRTDSTSDEEHVTCLAFFIPESARFEAVFQAVVTTNRLEIPINWQHFKENILTNWTDVLRFFDPESGYGVVNNTQLVDAMKGMKLKEKTPSTAFDEFVAFFRKMIPPGSGNSVIEGWQRTNAGLIDIAEAKVRANLT